MPPQDRCRLYDALKAYTERAIAEHAAGCPERPPEMLFGGYSREWQPVAKGVFALRERPLPYWEICMLEHAEQRRDLPEYAAAGDAIRADPIASTQVDELVGTALSTRSQEVEHLVDRILWALVRRNESFAFSPPEFDEEFEKLISDLRRTEYDVLLYAPLLGVKADQAPIELENEIALVRFSDAEIARLLRVRLIEPFGLPDHAFLSDPTVGIRTRMPFPKIIGEQEQSQSLAEAQERTRRAVLDASEVVHALRVFKRGRFSTPGYVLMHDELGSGLSFGPLETAPGSARPAGDYELSTEESAALASFWPQFKQARRRGLVGSAIRRFSYAGERARADDRLVDLVIAGETLFLGDTGNPQERGELRYRYALRAAFYCDVGASRHDVFLFMRNGYDARSAIVHGGSPSSKLLKAVDGSQLTLPEFVEAVEEVIRRALKKAIEAPAQPRGPLVDWNALILGDG